jgi:L-aspartate oxidase
MRGAAPPIVIAGGGLAGLFCAIKLAPRPVLVLAPWGTGPAASSYWAQGGLAAAVEESDTPEIHAADTVRAGAGIVEADIALGMAREARERVEDLIGFGAPFDRTDAGLFLPSKEAAHSHRRVVRVKGDGAGRAIMEALTARARATPSISIVEDFAADRILTEGGRVVGLCARAADGEPRIFPCAALVLATGGLGHLYRVTTNPPQARGEGVAMAALAGALVADAEFVQFHPTAIDIGADPAPLATESLRGEGAKIVDRQGRRFLLDVDATAELAPRDIVARAVHAAIARGDGAYLDAREAIGATFPERFPAVYASCVAAGLDPVAEPIPIAPAAHYHMGGVWTDSRGRTTIAGLWAAGEVASTGVHGANRLASNSLLEAVVFGARIAKDIAGASLVAPSPAIAAEKEPCDARDESAIMTQLRAAMSADVGVIRDEAGLKRALKTITALLDEAKRPHIRNALTTALLIASAAVARRESRGAHFRTDFPEPRDELAHRSRLTLSDARRIAAEAAT